MATTRVLNEVIIHDDDMPRLSDSLWWLAPESIRLEDHRYLVVLEVACEDVRLAPGYCTRRLQKAAIELGITVATGDTEVIAERLSA